MQNTISTEVRIAAPIDRVWAALTEPDQVGSWFGNGQPTRIDLRPGGRIVFDHGHGDLPAVLETVEAPSLLAYRWSIVGAAGTDPTASNSTLVTFRLFPEDGETRVAFTEEGFASVTDDPEQAAHQYENNASGWAGILDSLRQHVEVQG
ncbi:MAG: SRPBCC domain-containing protein [Propionibacteriaceae bacterium]